MTDLIRADEDRALLEGVCRGDAESLEALYARHAAHLFRVAVRITGDACDADEVVQDVFLHVWKQSRRFDRLRGSVGSWLTMMTKSRALDCRRRAAVRGGRPQAVSAAGERAYFAHGLEPASLALRQSVSTVPAVQRIPLELAFFDGYTNAEIAMLLDQPLGTIKTRIRLALRRVRRALADRIREEPRLARAAR